jgi:hypothetical protein
MEDITLPVDYVDIIISEWMVSCKRNKKIVELMLSYLI